MTHNFGYPARGHSASAARPMHCLLAVLLAVVLSDAAIKASGWLGYWLNLGY